jgi:hypothetical protein
MGLGAPIEASVDPLAAPSSEQAIDTRFAVPTV